MINPQELKELVENYPKLVTAKRSIRHPELRILKYTKKVFYDNLWNAHPLLVECRGLVVDNDYNVVVKPFTKVFNYQENGTKIDRDELCTIVRKVNGFLGVATPWKDQVIISTTGSLDSKYVDLADKWVEPFKEKINRFSTDSISFAFEIVDKSDPHIISEKEGAYLIGAQYLDGVKANEYDLDYEWDKYYMGNFRPEWKSDIRFSDVLKLVKTVKYEGFMVYGQESGTVLKLKSPYYLTSKFFGRMGVDRLLKGLDKQSNFGIDEDFYPVVDYLRYNKDQFIQMDEQEKIKFVRDFIETEILK